MNTRRIIRIIEAAAVSAVLSLGGFPAASADAVAGAGFGPTAGVGGPGSYTGDSTSNNLCSAGHYSAADCAAASIGVGGPSSYTGASTANSRGGTASLGVGGVDSYTGQGTSGAAQNGTNATTRTVNYGPGHP
ncbi:hypothetical protein ACTXG7_08005 [Mycolicibacterium sp. Dal123E01]|uniref:hypothetical protein n=1 Tax=Mycolicibacterium sp. Dal123E01 TaxID=3457578 RepID=UPI00403E7F6A